MKSETAYRLTHEKQKKYSKTFPDFFSKHVLDKCFDIFQAMKYESLFITQQKHETKFQSRVYLPGKCNTLCVNVYMYMLI